MEFNAAVSFSNLSNNTRNKATSYFTLQA